MLKPGDSKCASYQTEGCEYAMWASNAKITFPDFVFCPETTHPLLPRNRGTGKLLIILYIADANLCLMMDSGYWILDIGCLIFDV